MIAGVKMNYERQCVNEPVTLVKAYTSFFELYTFLYVLRTSHTVYLPGVALVFNVPRLRNIYCPDND